MMLIQESSYIWIPGDTTLQEPTPVYVHENKVDNSFNRNFSTFSQPSPEINMAETSTPTIVYKRKKILRSSTTTVVYKWSSTPTFVYRRKKIHRSSTPTFVYLRRKAQQKPTSEENPKRKMLKSVGFSAIDDNSRSLESNMDIGMDTSQKNLHISFLRNHGALERYRDACLSKKLKTLKESNPRKATVDDSGPIVSMLRCVDPYTSKVRIGNDFQVEVPDWSDPIINDLNEYGEATEISHVECGCYQDLNCRKLSRLSSIGNWLQCRQVIDGDGAICGKWRRAPIFEIQTDNWECFRTILWDPPHADCAVPQELDTDEVLTQLEYIEMLRPRLTKIIRKVLARGSEHSSRGWNQTTWIL